MAATITPTIDEPLSGPRVALPGGGYAIGGPSEDGEAILIQAYDRSGRAAGQPIVAASDLPENWQFNTFGVSSDGKQFVVAWNSYETDDGGTSFHDAGYGAQVVDANGQPVGDRIALELPGDIEIPPVGRSVTALLDGSFAILGRQTDSGEPAQLFLHIVPASGGTAEGPIDLGINLVGDSSFEPPAKVWAVDGTLRVVTSADAEGTVLRRFNEDGEALGEPILLTHQTPEGAFSSNFADAIQLANGDVLVSWNNYGYGGKFGPGAALSTDFQRYDANGSQIGETIATERAASVAPLQDGGFVVLQDTSYSEGPAHYPGDNFFHLFDRNGEQVGEPVSADGARSLLALADGHVLAGDNVFDYAPSHDAQWGGKQAYVETWQEQEFLTREDGTEMLLSNAGVLMKPWIANFQAASDDDGINATANELANHLLGGNGANVFGGGGGNDKLYMLGGDDWGFGDGGNDLIDAGDGNDVLVGGLGNDSLAGGAGADTVAGDQGDDAVNGHDGDDIVHGAAGRDLVTGDDGADTLYGGNDDDWLNGSAGDDVLSGDRGADTLEGGAGADQFRFGSGSGNDIIIDFEYGATGDRIVVDVAGDGSLNGITIPDAAALFDAAEDTEDGVLIGLGGDHSILLAGLVKADLGADMFLLV